MLANTIKKKKKSSQDHLTQLCEENQGGKKPQCSGKACFYFSKHFTDIFPTLQHAREAVKIKKETEAGSKSALTDFLREGGQNSDVSL